MSKAVQEITTQDHSAHALCQGLAFPRSQFCRDVSAPESTDTDAALRESIQQAALDCSCYGYRRVMHELHRQDVRANHKRVLRLMREDSLLCLRKKHFMRRWMWPRPTSFGSPI